MQDVNLKSRIDRKYFVQYLKNNSWDYCQLAKASQGFSTPKAATKAMDDVMAFYSDFVKRHYRLVERTTIIVDERLEKFGKGW